MGLEPAEALAMSGDSNTDSSVNRGAISHGVSSDGEEADLLQGHDAQQELVNVTLDHMVQLDSDGNNVNSAESDNIVPVFGLVTEPPSDNTSQSPADTENTPHPSADVDCSANPQAGEQGTDSNSGRDSQTRTEERMSNPHSNVNDQTNEEVMANSQIASFEFIRMTDVPAMDSEDIRNLNSQSVPSFGQIGGLMNCISYMSHMFPTMTTGMYGFLRRNPAINDKETISNSDQGSFESWLRGCIPQSYINVLIEDEQRFRNCLLQAINEYFQRLREHELQLFQAGCFTDEELVYARANQPFRRILLMFLQRDARTMLSFLHNLSTCGSTIVADILGYLQRLLAIELTQRHYQCARCMLKGRVSICLIVDHLPGLDCREITDFVNAVSEENQHVATPSVSERLWERLFRILESPNIYERAVQRLIEVLESCRYHSDIVRLLREEVESRRNIFACRCRELSCDQTLSDGLIHINHRSLDHHETSDISNETSTSSDQSVQSVIFKKPPLPKQAHLRANSSRTAQYLTKLPNQEQDIQATDAEDDTRENVHNNDKHIPRIEKEEANDKNKTGHGGTNISNTSEHRPKESNGNSIGTKRKVPISTEENSRNKRSRNQSDDDGGNCDLQMELLKIEPGAEVQQDSDFDSWKTNSTEPDSGVYDFPSAITPENSVRNEETASKETMVHPETPTIDRNSNLNTPSETSDDPTRDTSTLAQSNSEVQSTINTSDINVNVEDTTSGEQNSEHDSDDCTTMAYLNE